MLIDYQIEDQDGTNEAAARLISDPKPHPLSDKLDEPVAHVFYAIFFGLSLFMILFSVATFLWYKAYRNLSSLTLIGL